MQVDLVDQAGGQVLIDGVGAAMDGDIPGASRRLCQGERRAEPVGYKCQTAEMDDETVTLYRPTGPKELALVEAANWAAWPPRLPEQPIFYPASMRAYATKIARDWNVPRGGAGFVTRFKVRKSYLDRYEVHQVGGREHLEYWIPAEELDEFNEHIVGQIEVVAEFR